MDSPIASSDSSGEPGDKEILATVVILGVICFIGTLGNGLVIYVYGHKNDKQTSTLFILVLAVADFITCIFIIPFTMLNEYLHWEISSWFFCRLYYVVNTANISFASLLISAIAVDRYLCICHPFVRAMTVYRAKVIVGVLALLSLVLGCLAANFAFIEAFSHNATKLSPNKTLITYVYSSEVCTDPMGSQNNFTSAESQLFFQIIHKLNHLCFVFCIVIVIILYILIYRTILTIRRKKRMLKGGNVKFKNGNDDANRPLNQEDGGKSSSTCQIVVHTQEADSSCPPKKGGDKDTTFNTIGMPPNNDAQYNSQSLIPCPDNEIELSLNESRSTTTNENKHKSTTIKGKYFKVDADTVNNFKTALMLFVVAIVFILTFLPGILMANGLLSLNLIGFYMYYLNNTANPIIYCFMNQNFRQDVRNLLTTGHLPPARPANKSFAR